MTAMHASQISTTETRLQGDALSPGLAMGRICRLGRVFQTPSARFHIAEEEVSSEVDRFIQAVKKTEAELESAYHQIAKALPPTEAEIFRVHQMILKDRAFCGGVKDSIREKRINAGAALRETVGLWKRRLTALPDGHLRERGLDLEDIGLRVCRHLGDCSQTHRCSLRDPEAKIGYAEQLTPSVVTDIDPKLFAGLVVGEASRTSHGAILARSLNIPIVTGLSGLSEALNCGTTAILDGERGLLILDPTAATREAYQDQLKENEIALRMLAGAESRTQDGVPITLEANASCLNDVRAASRQGASGIGLFRTEFPYMACETLPCEEDLYRLYREVIETSPTPVTFRLLDIGGDKCPSYLNLAKEENPYLGQRGVRLYESHPYLIEPQLTALLRAGTAGPFRLLIPMVSVLEEIEAVQGRIEAVIRVLDREGVPYSTDYELGIMVETPAAFLIFRTLAPKIDFASIGTNDLIQYVMSFDRNHPTPSPLLHGLQPAMLGIYRDLVQIARDEGIELSLCGEMAADLANLPVLIGLGLRRFSMNLGSIPRAKRILPKLSGKTCEELVCRLQGLEHLQAIQTEVRGFLEAQDIGV